MDSPERASDALPALEGVDQDACASLKDGAPTRGPSNADQGAREAPSAERAIGSPLRARQSSLATSGTYKARLPDKLVLGSYVKPTE